MCCRYETIGSGHGNNVVWDTVEGGKPLEYTARAVPEPLAEIEGETSRDCCHFEVNYEHCQRHFVPMRARRATAVAGPWHSDSCSCRPAASHSASLPQVEVEHLLTFRCGIKLRFLPQWYLV